MLGGGPSSGDGAVAIRDDEALAALYPAQIAAEVLTQLGDAHGRDVHEGSNSRAAHLRALRSDLTSRCGGTSDRIPKLPAPWTPTRSS